MQAPRAFGAVVRILYYGVKKEKTLLRVSSLFCIKATIKIFFAFFNKVLNSNEKTMQSIVYHQRLAVVYHQCEALYIIKPQEMHADA